MEMPSAEAQHKWLKQWVGEWAYEHEIPGGPGEASMKLSGRETVRSVGDLWIVGESRGEMPGGGAANMMLTVGYNPAKKRFVGSWVGSMMTHLWVYDGTLDESGRVLTLNTEGPACMGESKLTQYKDVYELKSPDHRVLSSFMMGEDGRWAPLVTANYRRVK